MSSWGTNPWSNFCDCQGELIHWNKWHPETSEISTPLEIAAGTHFHGWTWHQNYSGIFTSWWRSLLVATSKFGVLTIRRHSATSKHLFLYPQGDRSGLRKQKKNKHQHNTHLIDKLEREQQQTREEAIKEVVPDTSSASQAVVVVSDDDEDD